MKTVSDIECTWTRSFALAMPVTSKGVRWLKRNCQYVANSLGQPLPIEFRYLEDIVLGARADGLVVTSTNQAP